MKRAIYSIVLSVFMAGGQSHAELFNSCDEGLTPRSSTIRTFHQKVDLLRGHELPPASVSHFGQERRFEGGIVTQKHLDRFHRLGNILNQLRADAFRFRAANGRRSKTNFRSGISNEDRVQASEFFDTLLIYFARDFQWVSSDPSMKPALSKALAMRQSDWVYESLDSLRNFAQEIASSASSEEAQIFLMKLELGFAGAEFSFLGTKNAALIVDSVIFDFIKKNATREL